MKLLSQLLELSRISKKFILGSLDVVLSLFSLELAFLMRLEEWVRIDDKWFPLFVLTPLLTLLIFYLAGLYRMVIRHVSLDAVIRIIFAVGAVSALIWISNYFLLKVPGLPRSIIAIFGLVLLGLVLSSRLAMHALLLRESRVRKRQIPIAIYGANKTGIQLATLWKSIGSDYNPIFFIDEAPEQQTQEMVGLRVYPLSGLEKQLAKYHIKDIFVVLQTDGLSDEASVAILNKLSLYPVKVRLLPATIGDRFSMKDTKVVQIEDLLKRRQVAPNKMLLERDITGNNILVTGAGGSIGSQLCEQIINLQPQKLFVIEQSEYALFRLVNRLQKLETFSKAKFVPILESVTNRHFINHFFSQNRIDIIYHVAAYKHVPMVEENIISGISNNVFGTQIVAEAALKHKVGCFVLISTDKAVQPTSVMGASKRLAEMVIQSLAADNDATRLCVVRFGNVMGTSGSVIPLFQEHINKRETIYVTDADAERYFMTVEEAAQLIIQAGAMGSKGEIFLLDMGEPINILEIAKKMIHLSGLEVKQNGKGDIKIAYTGLRPGEKLKEKLHSGSSDIHSTTHPKIMQTEEAIEDWQQLSAQLLSLATQIERRDAAMTISRLKEVVSSYEPSHNGVGNG
ncbi:MAG: polysaccharide biosynthesis protein [Chromatiales bacterium]|nr:polysaccharide biosynthesis protein [Chromatiales bacterium]